MQAYYTKQYILTAQKLFFEGFCRIEDVRALPLNGRERPCEFDSSQFVHMVKELEQAIQKAEALSPAERTAIAAITETEIADEERWRRRFEATASTLSKTAERAKRQYDEGLCDEL